MFNALKRNGFAVSMLLAVACSSNEAVEKPLGGGGEPGEDAALSAGDANVGAGADAASGDTADGGVGDASVTTRQDAAPGSAAEGGARDGSIGDEGGAGASGTNLPDAAGAIDGGPVDAAEGGAEPCPAPAVRTVESCAVPEDESRWDGGSRLYVSHEPDCLGHAPCFAGIYPAIEASSDGDVIVLLPGTYSGASVSFGSGVRSLRITGVDRETCIIDGTIQISGEQAPGEQLWIDHLTFRGPSPSGWGVYVSTFSSVDVRIQDNIFEQHSGDGGLALWSNTVRTRFHAVVARNRFIDNFGQEAALSIDLPSDPEEDYCIRLENNVIARNRWGLQVFYLPFDPTPSRFEIVNNTITGNEVGIALARPAGNFDFSNNVIYGSDRDLPDSIEYRSSFDFSNNLIGSGHFSGLRGNFVADPLFIDPEALDFRLNAGSPAIARGDATRAPNLDIDGALRNARPDLGAFERTVCPEGEPVGPICGDGVAVVGSVATSAGVFEGFEHCDDGNSEDGDGCSSACQPEPSGPLGLISMSQSFSLCAIRSDQSLSCWNEASFNVPTGTFQQVAVSAYHACALRTDGTIACWRRGAMNMPFTPAGTFSQISSDYDQTCGIRTDGSVECWDYRESLLSEAGNFARVYTNSRVCALTAVGEMTCWEPYASFVDGPFVQVLPAPYGGCGLRVSGELECAIDPNAGLILEDTLATALLRFHARGNNAVGIRPNGQLVQWGGSVGMALPAPEREFVEGVAGFFGGCGLTAAREVYCWGDNVGFPQE